MPATWKVELKNLKETQKKAIQTFEDLHGPPMIQAMRTGTLLVTRSSKQLAKADTGRYRASITPDIRVHGTKVEGIVGSVLDYAPFVVLDTKPHFPPISAIVAWVHRKGLGGKVIKQGKVRRASRKAELRIAYLIARKIARTGTKGDMSLFKALEMHSPRIQALIQKAVETSIRK